jgi:sec-independent protein translocase protein TatB
MFDIGWAEMGVIALVTLVVMGPKELPNALRTFAYWVKKVRGMAREFQSGVDQLIREAELDEAKKKLQSAAGLNLNREIEKAIDPERALDKALALPTEPKAVPGATDAKPAEATTAVVGETAPALPSAEVKPFPVPGVTVPGVPVTGVPVQSGPVPSGPAPSGPVSGVAGGTAAASLRPNGNAAPGESGAGVAIGIAKPAAIAPANGDSGEDAPSRKAQSG